MKTAQQSKKLHTGKVVWLKTTESTGKDLQKECVLRINQHVKKCITNSQAPNAGEKFFQAEKRIIQEAYQFGILLLQLFLVSAHYRLDYDKWLSGGKYYFNKILRYRTIKTFFGEVSYGRYYLARKTDEGGGIYPLDKDLALTRDGFSPLVISFVALLSTRMSFSSACDVFKRFCDWAPSTEAVQRLVLGLGREANAYMALPNERYANDGDFLVIEVDGKATPTATEEELAKRRGKRKKDEGCRCGCQRHRGQCKRKNSKPRKRRAKGDKSKNGRSITLVAMYTLKRGEDGLLHGPINKKIWGSYARRDEIMKWARAQAIIRGFDPETSQNIHIVMDGEKTLYTRLSEYFQKATFALDIRHLEEKIWDVGRAFNNEGSEELSQWVEGYRTLLYEGKAAQLIDEFKALLGTLSARAKRDEKKRDRLRDIVQYMDTRLQMMNYKRYIENDLAIASGVIEGAVRYVIGERMDCSGMRWIPQKAEALLHLRCIDINGEWDRFFDWAYHRWADELAKGLDVLIRTDKGIDLGEKFAKAA